MAAVFIDLSSQTALALSIFNHLLYLFPTNNKFRSLRVRMFVTQSHKNSRTDSDEIWRESSLW